MNWILLTLVACALVTLKQALYREFGFVLWMPVVVLAILIVAEYSFCSAFSKAPSFFSAWFIGYIALAVFGVIASQILGDAGITLKQYIGMFLSILAGYLLIS